MRRCRFGFFATDAASASACYRSLVRLAAPLLTLLWTLLIATPSFAVEDHEWRFNVLLDGSSIGSQTFRLSRDGNLSRVSIEADFDVKLLFFSVYTYQHRNEEVWDGDCLRSMRSTTNDNGEHFWVNADHHDETMQVDTQGSHEKLPSCTKSFAYWNPADLRDSHLLNSQTGEYEEVSLHELGTDTIDFRGTATPARHIAIEGEKLRIELWYSKDGDWLGLDSTTKTGRKLHYARQ